MNKISAIRGRLAEIEARAEAATPGPWDFDDTCEYGPTISRDPGGSDPEMIIDDVLSIRRVPDAEFTAHARTDIPYLVRLLTAALTVVETAQEYAEMPDDSEEYQWRAALDELGSDLSAFEELTRGTE